MRAPDFWISKGIGASALAALLSPVGALYGLAASVTNAKARPVRPHAHVLCVGNLTVGGTGKTPIAIALARMLATRGLKTVFLTRGYGGRLTGPVCVDIDRHTAADVGDEPLLLAKAGPTVVSRDRAAGADLADHLEADIIIMDDGHQNFSLAKDMSIVIVDAETGIGNGRLFPAGPLRERADDGFARADAIVLMGEGTPPLPRFTGAILRAHLVPQTGGTLNGKALLAFAGIGRPEKFFATLRGMGANVSGAQAFADHHPYSQSELAALRAAAQERHLLLVTTEKDYIRIDPGDRQGIVPVPVVAEIGEADALARLLDKLPPKKGGARR